MTDPHAGLLLSNDVFFCYYQDDIVLLRLSANKYSRLHSKEAAFLHELTKAASAPSSSARTPQREAAEDDQAAVAKRLVDLGVLTPSREAGRPVAPTVSALPAEHLVDIIPQSRPAIRVSHVAAFVWAATVATLELALIARRRKGFGGPVRRIRKRNARLRDRPAKADARDLVTIFNDLRPFWPRPALCRFDSLALIYFLGCFRLRAQWVFGVQLDPFHAHCWVQDERRLYNDDLENIAPYQPIMVVD